MQITKSEETTPDQETCLDQLDLGFYIALSLHVSGVLILRDIKDTPACICDGSNFEYGPPGDTSMAK